MKLFSAQKIQITLHLLDSFSTVRNDDSSSSSSSLRDGLSEEKFLAFVECVCVSEMMMMMTTTTTTMCTGETQQWRDLL
jgi:hypothetical protein